MGSEEGMAQQDNPSAATCTDDALKNEATYIGDGHAEGAKEAKEMKQSMK